MDLQPASIAHKGDYYWYSDTNFCLRRLDIKDGSTKQILKDKERRVNYARYILDEYAETREHP